MFKMAYVSMSILITISLVVCLTGIEYLSADPYGQPLSSLHHAPLHHYNQLTGLRPTQDQLGIHRTHREAELQGHVVSGICILLIISLATAINSRMYKFE